MSLDLIARLVVAVALIWAGVSKAVSRDPSVLAPYGVPRSWRGAALATLAGAELATGILLLAGAPGAGIAAFALGCLFVGALAGVRARGIPRIRCGCFGAKERSTDFLLARAAVFTGLAAFGAFGSVETGSPSRDALTVAALGALAGAPGAGIAAFALGCLFVGALAGVRARGIPRIRCGCFGAKERSTDFLLARAAVYTGLAAFGAFGSVETGSPSRDALTVAALGALAVAVVVLAVLVLALYRQVGVLTMRLGPGVALELAEEGPPIGEEAPALEGLNRIGEELVAFFSPDCRLCREIAPGVRAFEREGMPVRTVYENEEPDAFARWSVPGTPFLVHVVDGFAAAKGTVNSLEQLDGLVALGSARMEHAPA